MPVEVREPELDAARARAAASSRPILHPLATTGIVFVVLIFILLQREDLRDRMIRLFGSRDLHRTTTAMDDAARRLSRYYLTQLALERRLRRLHRGSGSVAHRRAEPGPVGHPRRR